MLKKQQRHKALLDLIRDNQIKTQDEIVEKLNEQGLKVTQATVSRDIKDLHIFKVTSYNGEQYYSWGLEGVSKYATDVAEMLKEDGSLVDSSETDYRDRVKVIFKEAVLKAEAAYFLIVVRTLPGMAQAAAHAIDTLKWNEIAGTLAGDDTIFVALKKEQDVSEVLRKFEELMK